MSHSRKDCISFFMTTRCNLECDYCYLKNIKLPHQSINLEFAKIALKDYFDQSQSRHIRFFGAGEPTLEIQKIINIRNYAFELAGKKLICEIQTNGIFSESVAEWLVNNIDIIWFSIDGPDQLNDQQRKSKNGKAVTKIIERNIKLLVSAQRKIIVGVRPTITPLTVDKQDQIIRYFHQLGVKAVYSDPVFPPVATSSQNIPKIPAYNEFIMNYATKYLAAKELADKLGVFYGSILTVNFDEKAEIACRSCIPSPHITTDGYVTCCDMSYMGNIFPELIYGKYDIVANTITYDNKKIQAIKLRRASSLKQCSECEVLYNCAGGCLGEGLNETGHLLGVKTDYCEAIRFLAKHLQLNNGLYQYSHP